ncbi:MAG: TPM domain-containing protein [Treponema sp.]|nr:TPM domain-containing protein [Treponema sp.]
MRTEIEIYARITKLKSVFFVFLILFCKNFFALEIPALTSPVVDNAKIMSEAKRQELEEFLLAFDKNSSAQIAVLTIPSLKDESLEEYSIKVAREWGLGNAEDSKGVLLLIAFNEKKIRIETGYGVEGDLTDAKCGMIIRNVIAPNFQNGKYSEGIIKGAKAIAKIIAPDALDSSGVEIEKDVEADPVAIIAMTIFFILYFIMFTGMLSTKFNLLRRWLPWAPFFVSRANSPVRRTPYYTTGGFHSGSGGFGGGSHGGFSGGGGGFGGGGASGGW